MNNLITFAVIGDSAASGVGDSDHENNYFGWCYHLAKASNSEIRYLNFSRPGAQSKEVAKIQLPKILNFKPDLVAVIVGGNDLLRNGFSPAALEKNLDETLRRIEELGAISMLIELHDPTQIVPMPKLLKCVCIKRVNAVNHITRKLSTRYGSIYLDTRSLPDIYAIEKWHVDRMHPSRFGHQFLADSFAHLLRQRGFDFGNVTLDPINNRNTKDSIMWMIKNGTPWFLKRSFDLLPALILLMAREAIALLREKVSNNEAELYFPHFDKSSTNSLIDGENLRVS